MDINEKCRSKLLSRLGEQPVVEGIASAQSIPEINQIAEIWNNNNWLPTLDTFRTFAGQLAR